MCASRYLTLCLVIYFAQCAPILPNVQTGYVPIFGTRGGVSMQPMTFTFTTPTPKMNQMKHFPTLRPYFPGKEFKYEVQMPTQMRNLNMNFVTVPTTPLYNKAQFYKSMQASLQQDVFSTYRTILKQMGDTWTKLRSELLDEGVEQDWRVFWQKFTGTVEPYMNSISSQVGRLYNVFVRHQQDNQRKG